MGLLKIEDTHTDTPDEPIRRFFDDCYISPLVEKKPLYGLLGASQGQIPKMETVPHYWGTADGRNNGTWGHRSGRYSPQNWGQCASVLPNVAKSGTKKVGKTAPP